MDEQRRTKISRYLSKHLRHQPERLGLELEPGGWVRVSDLLASCRRNGVAFSEDDLREMVALNNKQRFAFDESGQRIRANQGHSVEVDLGLEPLEPPAELYHGTAEHNLAAIERDGLQKMRRHHVHLSADIPTALAVGKRHGRPAVLVVAAGQMLADGFTFFCSANGVWLVDEVPARYLRRSEERQP